MPDLFTEFWKAYPHRPKTRPKKLAMAYWHGHKPLADGSHMTPEDWPAAVEGAKAYRQLAGDDPRRINAGRFLYQGEWEGAAEELAELQEKTAAISEESRRRIRMVQFNRDYQARRIEERQKGNENYSVEDYRAELQRSRLRVVGER